MDRLCEIMKNGLLTMSAPPATNSLDVLGHSRGSNKKEMENMEDKVFATKDVYLASFLSVILKLQPTFKQEGTLVFFCFDETQDLRNAITDYHSGMSVEAYKLIAVIRRLRASMLNLKHGGQPHEV